MKHPILKDSGYKIYLMLWLGIILCHGAILYYYYELPIKYAAADSLVFNLLFAAIAPGFWFILRYASLNNDKVSLGISHLGSALVTVGAWTALSKYILNTIFSESESYLNFLDGSYIWRMVVGVTFYVICMLVFYLIRYYQERQLQVGRELELQTLLKDSELQMLKSQINPHFIFNSLNSISSLTMTSPEQAQAMVIKLSDFLRFSLGKKNDEMNPFGQELESARLYLDIEKIRFGNKLNVNMELEDGCETVSVPNLILQPLIENAVKYGIYDSSKALQIDLRSHFVKGNLVLELTNTYDDEAVASKGTGIGIENVKRRMNLIYGDGELVKVSKEKDKFKVTLEFPVDA